MKKQIFKIILGIVLVISSYFLMGITEELNVYMYILRMGFATVFLLGVISIIKGGIGVLEEFT